MNLRKAMWWLASIWFIGAGLCFIVLVGQSQVGTFDSDTGAVWGWFLPTVMPTLSLIVELPRGGLSKDSGSALGTSETAASPVFWLGAVLSGFYLLLLGTTITISSIQVEAAPLGGDAALESLARSRCRVSALAALGFFFQSKS